MRVMLVFRLATDGTIDPGVATGGRLRREARERNDPPGPTEICAAIGTIEERIERRGERVDVPRRNQQTGPIVLHGIRESTAVKGNHRRLAQLRFYGDEPQTFVSRRHHQCCRSTLKLGEARLWQVAQPSYAIGDT